jgi:hypothetical protein
MEITRVQVVCFEVFRFSLHLRSICKPKLPKPFKGRSYFEEITKSDEIHPKVERF